MTKKKRVSQETLIKTLLQQKQPNQLGIRLSKSIAFLLVIVLLTASCVLIIPIKADSRTIIVPDDFPTIQAAINNANAGDTIFVRNGTYEGEIDKTLVIDRSISLIGESLETTLNLHPKYSITWILTASFLSSEDALQITAKDVTISNLTIKYTGDIRVSNEKAQFIETKLKTVSTSTGLVINGSECNLSKNSLNGRVSVQSSSNIVFENNLYGLRIDSGNNNIIEDNDFHYLTLKGSDNNIISKNNIGTDNVSPVIEIRNSSFNVLFDNNITSHLWNTNLNIGEKSHNNTIYENNFLCPAYTNLNSSEYFYSNKEVVSVDLTAFGNFWEKNGMGNY